MAVTQPNLTGLDDGPSVKRKADTSHRRVARPIAAAMVRVSPGVIEIVVPDVLGKNEAHRKGRGNTYTSTAVKKYRASVAAGMRVAVWETGTLPCMGHSGAWRVEIVGVWPDQRHTIKGRPVDFTPCPEGDCDATLAQVLDALQQAQIIDDDARVVEVRAWNLYRKGERWTVIRLVRVPDLAERDAAIAHLVAMLPPPAAPAEPKLRTKAARRKRKETT